MASVDRRRHRARTDADDQDAVRREFDPGGARQHPHAALGQAVGGVARHRPVLVHRGDVDDPAAAALLDHLLGRDLRAEERALEIDRTAPCRTAASVVSSTEVRVSTPALFTMMSSRPNLAHRGVDQRLQIVDPADVGLDADRLLAQRGDLALQRVGRLGMDDVVDDDVGARRGSILTTIRLGQSGRTTMP